MTTEADANGLTITFLTLGALFLAGFGLDALGKRTRLPRVTLLLVLGFAVGPAALDWLPDTRWFPLVSHMALAMVGFLLGNSLERGSLRESGRAVLWVSITVVLATTALVATGLMALGVAPALALLLGALATATDPAASSDVVREVRAEGPFTRTLLGIVAIDDAWGLIVFSVMMACAQFLAGTGSPGSALWAGVYDVGAAVGLGVLLGVPAAYLTGRVRAGEPTLAEALGVVFVCTGVALWLDVSFLLAAMVLGAVIANLAKHHERPFHAIEEVQWPFLILFFVLSGASLEIGALASVGWVAAAYCALRVLGRAVGGPLGARFAGLTPGTGWWLGVALTPQAGVALGMALVVGRRIPEVGEAVLPIVIASTVLFELVGPVLTRLALTRAGEVGIASG